MIFEGQIQKSGRFWTVEIPSLNLMTQGRSLNEAQSMAKALVEDAVDEKDFKVNINILNKNRFLIESSNSALMTGLMLKKLRQEKGLTIREVVDRLKASSTRSYSAYENGERNPSQETLAKLIKAIDPSFTPVTTLVKVG